MHLQNSMSRPKGIVLWFNEIHGNGLIYSRELQEVLRVDYRDIITDGYRVLQEGELIEFTLNRPKNAAKEIVSINDYHFD